MLDNYEPTIDETIIFRNVLLHNEEGRQVLKWLLLNLGMYKPLENERELILHNFAINLLNILDLVKQDQLEDMVDNLKAIADKDALHPRKTKDIRSELNGQRKYY